MALPPELAKLTAEQAGERYMPSNGTEGAVFWEEWCVKCARDKTMSEGKDFDSCEPGETCKILAASFAGSVAEWVYGSDGQPMCTAFVKAGTTVVERCDRTMDMFEQAGGD